MQSNKERFWIWFIVFGWEGPLGIWLGIKNHNTNFIISGVIITLLLWWLLPGIDLLKNYFK